MIPLMLVILATERYAAEEMRPVLMEDVHVECRASDELMLSNATVV